MVLLTSQPILSEVFRLMFSLIYSLLFHSHHRIIQIMATPVQLRVTVVGAGLAGLAITAALRQVGHVVGVM